MRSGTGLFAVLANLFLTACSFDPDVIAASAEFRCNNGDYDHVLTVRAPGGTEVTHNPYGNDYKKIYTVPDSGVLSITTTLPSPFASEQRLQLAKGIRRDEIRVPIPTNDLSQWPAGDGRKALFVATGGSPITEMALPHIEIAQGKFEVQLPVCPAHYGSESNGFEYAKDNRFPVRATITLPDFLLWPPERLSNGLTRWHSCTFSCGQDLTLPDRFTRLGEIPLSWKPQDRIQYRGDIDGPISFPSREDSASCGTRQALMVKRHGSTHSLSRSDSFDPKCLLLKADVTHKLGKKLETCHYSYVRDGEITGSAGTVTRYLGSDTVILSERASGKVLATREFTTQPAPCELTDVHYGVPREQPGNTERDAFVGNDIIDGWLAQFLPK